MIKSKNLQPRLLYPARLSFKVEGEIRSFPDKKKLKEFVNNKCKRADFKKKKEKKQRK